jgi:peptidyl-prolyl cis-trans isomerase B (cyclophilin B)
MRAAAYVVFVLTSLACIAAAAPLPAPTPSASASSPLGEIGLLERAHTTNPAQLSKYLNGADPTVAARAALAIGRLGNPAGNQILISVLNDGKQPESVRSYAAFGLGLIGSPSSIDALAAATRRAPPPVAAMAANALGRIGGNAAIDALWPLLNSGASGVRASAAVALGVAALPGAVSLDYAHRTVAGNALATNIASERDGEVRWREAWALSRGYYAGEAPALRRLLTDDEELVRMFAVEGFRRLRDRSYALPVRLLANDSSWRVRAEVRSTLAALRDPTPVKIDLPAIPAIDLATPKPVRSSAPFGAHPQVAIVTTKGVIVLELFPDVAPYSVDNFLSLVDRGFYNNLSYFRVIQNFVIQGGDPKNNGTGGPGYTIPAELNPVEQLTGIISYGLDYDQRANVPLINSAGSQYYITESPQLHLDQAFTVFGRVVRGMAVVDAITPKPGPGRTDVAKLVYRCEPVTPQTDEVEQKLRTAEIGYDAR